MTDTEKQTILQFAQKFCLDNNGNRLNEWLIESFLNRLWEKMRGMHQPNDAQGSGNGN
ncbi:MAG: hypothetical protein AB1611_03160 [bacterium]